MGGEGSGRKPDITNKILRQSEEQRTAIANTVQGDSLYLPNYSGIKTEALKITPVTILSGSGTAGQIAIFNNTNSISSSGYFTAGAIGDSAYLTVGNSEKDGFLKLVERTNGNQTLIYTHPDGMTQLINNNGGNDTLISIDDTTLTATYNGTIFVDGISCGGTTASQVFSASTRFTTANGSSGVPSYNFTNDTNTGFYWDTADQINMSLGGTESFNFFNTSGEPTIASTTSTAIRLNANGQNVFRGLDGQTVGWTDGVTCTYFQVGRSSGNMVYTALNGTLFSRIAFAASKVQISDATNNSVVPTHRFQVDISNVRVWGIDTSGHMDIADGKNIVLSGANGTKIGTATSQKLAFYNATPIVQVTTGVTAATFTANTSGIANDTATFDGYTIGQVVKALRNLGLLA